MLYTILKIQILFTTTTTTTTIIIIIIIIIIIVVVVIIIIIIITSHQSVHQSSLSPTEHWPTTYAHHLTVA